MVVIRDPPPTANTSTLGSFSHDEIEDAVIAVFGSSPASPSLRRFSMGEMMEVDDITMAIIQGSSRWKGSISHIERVIQTERVASAAKADFVARTFRQRPGVVYAVRYRRIAREVGTRYSLMVGSLSEQGANRRSHFCVNCSVKCLM